MPHCLSKVIVQQKPKTQLTQWTSWEVCLCDRIWWRSQAALDCRRCVEQRSEYSYLPPNILGFLPLRGQACRLPLVTIVRSFYRHRWKDLLDTDLTTRPSFIDQLRWIQQMSRVTSTILLNRAGKNLTNHFTLISRVPATIPSTVDTVNGSNCPFGRRMTSGFSK